MSLSCLCPALESLLQRAVPVENCDDEHPLGFNQIDQPIGPDDELAETRELRVTQAVSSVRGSDQRLSCLDRQLRQAARVRFRVPRYELDGRLEILYGWIGPDYLASHFARRFLTCSWL